MVRLTAAATVAAVIALAGTPDAQAYQYNTMVWPGATATVYINPANEPTFPNGKTGTDIILEALEVWNATSCSDFIFVYGGTTDAELTKDDQNVIWWENDTWIASDQAPGATKWLHTAGQPMEFDLGLNLVNFLWEYGGGTIEETEKVDPLGVIVHELGHGLGLGHSAAEFSTMYLAHLPNGLQGSLDADDKQAICALYPSATTPDMCDVDGDCLLGEVCVKEDGQPAVCDIPHEGTGAFCSIDYLNCEGMCWISFQECEAVCAWTKEDYSEGYCAPLCAETGECPEGWTCVDIPENSTSVCYTDESLGVEPDPELGGDDAEVVEAGPDAGPEPGVEPVDEASQGDTGDGVDAGPSDLMDDAPGTTGPDTSDNPGGGGGGDGGCSTSGGPGPSSLLWMLAAGLFFVSRRRS